MKKRMLSLLLAVCLVVSMAPAAFAANGTTTAADTEKATTATEQGAKLYSDVPENSWFYESVDTVTKSGYFNGYADGTFKPSDAMTRAMFVTVISRMAKAETDNSVTKFPDVPVNTWYTGAVTWANENGIVLGRSETVFDPNTAITRIEMCIIMSRYVKYLAAETGKTPEASKETKTFTDTASLSESYMDALTNCVAYGLIGGYADGTFKPNNGATRAEVATVVARFAAKTEEKKPDTSGGGYYYPSTPSGPSEPSLDSFTVTYDMPNGGHSITRTETQKETGADVTHTVLSWDTYVKDPVAGNPEAPVNEAFANWVDKNNAEKKYTAGDVITLTGNVTLVPQFVNTEDLLFAAMQNAEQNAKGWFNGKHLAVENDPDAKAALTYGNVTLDRVAVTGTDTDTAANTRNIYVDGSASIQGLTMENKIVEIAAQIASGALGEEAAKDVSYYREQLTKLVEDVAEAIGAPIDGSGVRAIVDSLYTWGAQQARNKILAGCGLTDAISEMTVEVNGASAKITVDETTHALTLDGDKTTVAKNLGVALAKELYKSAQENNTQDYTSDVKMGATIELEFKTVSVKNLDKYPYKYDVVVALTLSDEGKVLSYKHVAGADYIKVTIPTSVQGNYSAEINTVVESFMKSKAFTDKISGVESSIVKDASFKQLIDAIAQFNNTTDKTAATTQVTTAISSWITANLNSTDLNNNVLYEHYWGPNANTGNLADKLDNSAFYGTTATDAGLIGEVTKGAVSYFNTEMTRLKSDFANGRPAMEAMFDGFVETIFGDENNKTPLADFEDAITSFLGLINSQSQSGSATSGGLNFDVLDELDPAISNFVYAAIIDDHWGNNVEKTNCYVAMTEVLDETIGDQLDHQLEGKVNGVELGTVLGELAGLGSIESIANLTVEELITTLDNITKLASTGTAGGGDGTSLIDKYGQSIISYIKRGANALANRNVEVTVKFGGTINTEKTLTKQALEDIAKQPQTKLLDFLKAIQDLKLAELKLNYFDEDFCTITVTSGNSNTPITVVPVIEIP